MRNDHMLMSTWKFLSAQAELNHVGPRICLIQAIPTHAPWCEGSGLDFTTVELIYTVDQCI